MPEGGTHERRSLIEQGSEPNDAGPFLPDTRSFQALRDAAARCRGCHLWRGATQTVFGDGLNRARIVFRGRAARRQGGQGGPAVRRAEREAFTDDLRLVAEALG